jgi:protein SCO1/2
MQIRRSVTWLASLGLVLALVACHSQAPLPEQHFDLRGKVMAMDRNAGTVTLQHEAIPGYMAAMTMDYPVKDKWAFDVLKPGQTVQARLVVATDQAWLENIVVTQEANPAEGSPEAKEAGSAALGQEVPDFSLVNQDGSRLHLHQYRGKALLLTFIYTRCPLPNYCPLMSRNFAELLKQTQGDPKLADSVHLLSISIDPEYDQPAVLRAYGLEHVGDPYVFHLWEFASGTPQEVQKVAEFFGLKYWTQGGQIQHALVTAIVGSDGKVVKMYWGNGWTPADVLADLRALPGA